MNSKLLKGGKLLSVLLLMLACSMTFVSCGNDDDDDSPSTPSLIGTWHSYEDGVSMNLVFNKNQSGSITLTATSSSLSTSADSRASATVTMTENFSWATYSDSDGTKWLDIIHKSGDNIFGTGYVMYIIAGDQLAINGLGTFTK